MATGDDVSLVSVVYGFEPADAAAVAGVVTVYGYINEGSNQAQGSLVSAVYGWLAPIPDAVIAPNLPVVPGSIATFDGSTSEGSKFRWKWTTVPAGSANVNTQTAFPDSGAVTPIDMTDNAALYHLDALVGLTFADSSGLGNTATVSAGVSVGAGRGSASSAVFAGTSDTMVMATALPTSAADFSAAFWFKGLRANSTYRAGLHGVASNEYAIMVNTGTDALGVWDGSFQPTSTNFEMAAAAYTGWHQIMVVGTAAGEQTFYVDGAYAGKTTTTLTSAISSINNKSGSAYLFADEISEVATWSRAVSAKEAWDIYALQEGSYVGQTGKTNSLTFTADLAGVYEAELDSAFSGTVIATTNASMSAVSPGLIPFDGASLLSVTGDPFSGGYLRVWPIGWKS